MNKNSKKDSPDFILKKIEEKINKGKIKIFIGMAAGVGKTYSMLLEAINAKKKGKDVVLGYIEPHGRKETEDLTLDFEKIPLNHINYNGIVVNEFNLDLAIERKPEIILVDELAHSNIKSSRHEKRWQDVLELRNNGIEVWTTINIQHIESLSEIVTAITGITVRETVPDRILLECDSVELIDIQPEELIQRIKDGKIYKSDKLYSALNSFFTISNLTALRELVLRKVADRVDLDTLKYRELTGAVESWQTSQRILVAIGANPFAKQLIRAAHRISERRHGILIVMYVQIINQGIMSEDNKILLFEALKLAEELGAEIVQRIADNIPEEIIRFANSRNVTLIVAGKPANKKIYNFFIPTIIDKLIEKSGSIDVQLIKINVKKNSNYRLMKSKVLKPINILFPLILVSLLTLLCFFLQQFLSETNLIMIYLLGVIFISLRSSRLESIITSILSVLAFDFFFVPPVFTFSVNDFEYLVTFFIMLILSIIISSLTITIKNQNSTILEREETTNLLYRLVKKLLGINDTNQVYKLIHEVIYNNFDCDICIFDNNLNSFKVIVNSKTQFQLENNEILVAKWCLVNAKEAGFCTENLSSAKAYYLPIKSEKGSYGVIGIKISYLDPKIKNILELISQQGAQALDRINLEEESKRVELQNKIERDRNSLLSSISHDIRTPLTSINGSASVLLHERNIDENLAYELKLNIYDQSLKLSELVNKVLDLTKLENENIKLDLDWYPIEEIISSALEYLSPIIKNRKIDYNPKEITLAYIDGVIFQQVFVNLIENSVKHTPENSVISISIYKDQNKIIIIVSDNGGGISKEQESMIFTKSFKGSNSNMGFGLGLPICKTIVNLHHGNIYVRNKLGIGIDFVIELPLIEQPEIIYE